MLRWRLISAAVILAVLLALIWLDFRLLVFGTRGAWLLPALIGVSVLATEEVLSLLRLKGHRPVALVVYVANVVIPLAAAWPVVSSISGFRLTAVDSLGACGPPLAALAICVVLVLVGEMARFQQPGGAIVNAALSMFAIVY